MKEPSFLSFIPRAPQTSTKQFGTVESIASCSFPLVVIRYSDHRLGLLTCVQYIIVSSLEPSVSLLLASDIPSLSLSLSPQHYNSIPRIRSLDVLLFGAECKFKSCSINRWAIFSLRNAKSPVKVAPCRFSFINFLRLSCTV